MRPADQIIHKAAWLYYTHGLRQDEVARRLDISRASVAMYLRKARESGIVTITTSTRLFNADVLARQLEDRFGLEAVWVVAPSEQQAAVGGVPSVAATAFLELARSGDRIGVAWGKTVYAIADAMPYADLENVTVVQLCGNLGAPYEYRPDQCTMDIARRLNARGLNFYAPLVLSTQGLAAQLREEPIIREQLASVSDCTLALFSVGRADADAHVVLCGAMTPSGMTELRHAGAAAVIAGQMIDVEGQLVDCDYNRRCISADLDDLRRIPRRMMAVQEDEKFLPLKAALAGRFATHLVLTASLAEKLLADA